MESRFLIMRRQVFFFLFCLVVGLKLPVACRGEVRDDPKFRGSQFIAVTNLALFQRVETSSADEVTLRLPPVSPAIAWDELIVSWNAALPEAAWLKVQVREFSPAAPNKSYLLGVWSTGASPTHRHSVPNQGDPAADVKTDTFVAHHPIPTVQVEIVLPKASLVSAIKFLGLSFSQSRRNPGLLPPNQAAWGTVLSVPERSQMESPEGKTWCSPACNSMVLAYWAEKLHRPELNHTVSEVAGAVYDPNWPGTGNWPFNTAFAGAHKGMRGYVTRLTDLSEVEDWIAKGIPVVLSVSYSDLKGTKSLSTGHLVICVGFTESGDVLINDPGTRLNVRKLFPRQNVITAWAKSHNTCYLIYPESANRPLDRFKHWE